MTIEDGIVGRLASADLQQRTYRKILDAFSYPGTLQEQDHADGELLLLILATLIDERVSLSDQDGLIPADLDSFFEARRTSVEVADFLVCDVTKSIDSTLKPKLGTLYSPHEGATMLWRCSEIDGGSLRLKISGPGVENYKLITVGGLDPSWIQARKAWVARFPMGVDVIICDAHRFFGIPRTSFVSVN